MLDEKTLNNFVSETNHAYQQFCVWLYTNNELSKYWGKWNGIKYKNFWGIVIPTLQYSWILSLARLFDPAYFIRDTKKENPRLCLDYVLELLEDDSLVQTIKQQISNHKNSIDSIKEQRDNFLVHNSIKFNNTRIEVRAESLFKTLDNIITEIKNKNPHLKDCNNINREDTKKLSQDGIGEIFEALSKC